jgi:hypothetical protein
MLFGTIVDRLQSFLTRNFVIASFFPVLIFAAINIKALCLCFR